MQWLKYGCLGCLGLIGVAVLCVAVIIGLSYAQVRSEQVEKQAFQQELPLFPTPPVEGRGAILPTVSEPGRVILDMDLANGRVRIRPGEPGQSIRIESELDPKSYQLEGTYERYGEAGWIYRVRMRPKGATGALSGVRALLGGTVPRVDVLLPPGVPMSVEGEIAKGESNTELGGLWLTSVDLSISKGAHTVAFGRELPAPLERFAIRGGQGALMLQALGNASPREVDVQHSMGALDLDLRGPWRVDSTIRANASMGGFLIQLPEGVRIEGLDRVSVGMGNADVSSLSDRPDPGPDAPTLRFDVRASMGGLHVDG